MYLSNELIENSFSRLSFRQVDGKSPLERTSALMYFLSFDAVVKISGTSPLNLDPRNSHGKSQRDLMQLEYSRLIRLKCSEVNMYRQITTLGNVEKSATSPDKKISSNFFTVPLKKASDMNVPYCYPKRPAPLFQMGLVSTGSSWGVDYHPEWEPNLIKLISSIKSGTPFTDLAIWALRDFDFCDDSRDLRTQLMKGIYAKFSSKLSGFFEKRIKEEKIFRTDSILPFQDDYPIYLSEDPSSEAISSVRVDFLESQAKETLIERILCLEDILSLHGIEI